MRRKSKLHTPKMVQKVFSIAIEPLPVPMDFKMPSTEAIISGEDDN